MVSVFLDMLATVVDCTLNMSGLFLPGLVCGRYTELSPGGGARAFCVLGPFFLTSFSIFSTTVTFLKI